MKHAQATGLVIAILIAAAAAGFGVYQWLQPVHAPAVIAAAPTPVTSPAWSATETMNYSLNDLQGNGHRLADWHGKVVLVNFWATWCPPCREEIPLLVKLQAKYAAQGLQIVGIATDEQSEQDVRSFMKQVVVNYPILMGDDQTAQMVGGLGGQFIGLPYSIVLDRDGKVFKIHAGEFEPGQAEDLVRTALHLSTLTSQSPVTATQAN